jgi:hypothetical protein
VTSGATDSSTTPVYSQTNRGAVAPPVYIGPYRAQGRVSGGGEVRLSQNAVLHTPIGSHRRLLRLRGIGSLILACGESQVGRVRLTAWARGEGPAVIQRVLAHPTRPMALVPYTAAGGPLDLPNHGAPQTFQAWQVTIISEAFSANATILSLVTQTRHRCDLSAEATVITHGQFYRYAH